MPTPSPSAGSALSATPTATATPPDAALAPASPPPAPTAPLEALGLGARSVGEELPDLAQAAAILLIGWALAVVLARTTRRVLERAGFDERAVRVLGAAADGRPYPVSRWLGRTVFYAVLLFTLAAFADAAGMAALSTPLNYVTDQIVALLPGLVASAVLATVAWLLAQAVGFVVRRGALAARLDDRIGQEPGGSADEPAPSVVDGLVLGAQALVYLVFLPPILAALGLSELTAPLQAALAGVVALIPGMVAAGAILVATWLVARVAGQIAGGLARAMGLDRRAAGYGVRDVRLSSAVASAVSALVAIPGFVLAVNALGLPALAAPVNELVAQIASVIPAVAIASAFLAMAWFVGRVAADVVATVLAGVGFDRLPQRVGLPAETTAGEWSLSQLAGLVVQVAIVLSAAIVASDQVGLTALAEALVQLRDLALRTLTGVLIFLAGLYVAYLTRQAVLRVAGPGRRLLAVIAQAAVLVFALAAALTEVGVAQNIVTLTFLGVVAAVAGAVTLAAGLGGRDLAAQALSQAYRQLDAPETQPTEVDPPTMDEGS